MLCPLCNSLLSLQLQMQPFLGVSWAYCGLSASSFVDKGRAEVNLLRENLWLDVFMLF